MNDEGQDAADHLIDAVRMGAREGMTKEHFVKAAGVFWDTWHEAQEIMSIPNRGLVDPVVGTGCDCGGRNPCADPKCWHPLAGVVLVGDTEVSTGRVRCAVTGGDLGPSD